MKYVTGTFFSLETSMVSHSGNRSSVMNIFNAIPMSDFLAMGYIPAKKIPLDKS